jgi:NADH:ubiquinone oxidoreductase subunit 5 (subunit L)/multisubunit Na+/H+ antiporter MnhA subunit
MEFLPLIVKQTPTIASLLSIGVVYCFYNKLSSCSLYNFKLTSAKSIYVFLNNKWFFDHIYNFYLGTPAFKFAYKSCYKLLDKGLLELFGPFGVSNFILFCSKNLVCYQTGFIYNYVCLFILAFFLLLALVDLL